MGFPLAVESNKGPSQTLPFLGIKMDFQLTNYVISGDWYLAIETVGIPGGVFLRRMIWQSPTVKRGTDSRMDLFRGLNGSESMLLSYAEIITLDTCTPLATVVVKAVIIK